MGQDSLTTPQDVTPPSGYSLVSSKTPAETKKISPPKGYILKESKTPSAPKKTVKELKSQADKLKPISPPKGYILAAPKASVSAYDPTFWETLKSTVRNNPVSRAAHEVAPGVTDYLGISPDLSIAENLRQQASGQSDEMVNLRPLIENARLPNVPILRDIARSNSTQPAPLVQRFGTGLASVASGITTPGNAAIMAGTGGLGIFGDAAPIVGRLISAGFGVQMLKGLYDKSPEFKAALDQKNYGLAAEIAGEMAGTGAMAFMATKHALTSHPFTPVTETPTRERTNVLHRNTAGEVRQAKGQAPTVWLSPDAWKSFMGLMYPNEDSLDTNGLNLPANESLHGFATDPQVTAAYPEIADVQRLLAEAHKNANEGGIVIGSKTGKGVQHAVNVMREERNHTWQRKLTENKNINTHLPEKVFTNLNNAIPVGMKLYLGMNGYDIDHSPVMVAEAAAKLMGTTDFEKYGVTRDEAADFMHKYLTEVVNQHGVKALESLKNVRNIGAETKANIEANHGRLANGTADRGSFQRVSAGGGRTPESNEGTQPSGEGKQGEVALRSPNGNHLEPVDGGWIEHKPDNGGVVFHQTLPGQGVPAAGGEVDFNRERDPDSQMALFRQMGDKLKEARNNYSANKPETVTAYNEALRNYEFASPSFMRRYMREQMGQMKNAGDVADVQELERMSKLGDALFSREKAKEDSDKFKTAITTPVYEEGVAIPSVNVDVKFPPPKEMEEAWRDASMNAALHEQFKRTGITGFSIEEPYKFGLSVQGDIDPKTGEIRMSAAAANPAQTLAHEVAHDIYRRLTPQNREIVENYVKNSTHIYPNHTGGLEERIVDHFADDIAAPMSSSIPPSLRKIFFESPLEPRPVAPPEPNLPAVPEPKRPIYGTWSDVAQMGGTLRLGDDIRGLVAKDGDFPLVVKDTYGARHVMPASIAADVLDSPAHNYVEQVFMAKDHIYDKSTPELTRELERNKKMLQVNGYMSAKPGIDEPDPSRPLRESFRKELESDVAKAEKILADRKAGVPHKPVPVVPLDTVRTQSTGARMLTDAIKTFGNRDRLAAEYKSPQLPAGQDITTSEMRKSVGQEGVPLFNREQVKTPEFKQWFGDSKVVDKDGEPMVLYHGTTHDFDSFDPAKGELGSHFGTSEQSNAAIGNYGQEAKNIPVYLSIKNPLRLRDDGDFDPEHVSAQLIDKGMLDEKEFVYGSRNPSKNSKILRDIIKSNGYDGVVYLNRREGLPEDTEDGRFDHLSDEEFKEAVPEAQDSYITFEPTQVKSAIGNKGTFDPKDPNILRNREKPSGKEEDNIWLHQGVDKYTQENNLPPITPDPRYLQQDSRAKEIADAYEAMKHDPNNPAVAKSYSALKSEIKKQWDFATKKMGIKFEPWKGAEGTQPYKDSAEMAADVKNNHHLYFFQGGEMPADHPLAEIDPKTKLSFNDMLRGVHDLFGHAVESYEFGPRGEENAWRTHSQMFTKEALPALTTETKGQNSWVNAGAHMRDASGNVMEPEDKGYVLPKDRPFAEQKAGLLPERFYSRNVQGGRVYATSNTERDLSLEQAVARSSSKEFKQFIELAKQIDAALGASTKHHVAAGLYNGINEPSLITHIEGTPDIDVVRAAAALRGKLAKQESTMMWFDEDDGPDTAYLLSFPRETKQEVLARAKKAGYNNVTAEEVPGGGTLLSILHTDGETPKEDINGITDRLGARQGIRSAGHGTLIQARAYDKIIDGFRKRSVGTRSIREALGDNNLPSSQGRSDEVGDLLRNREKAESYYPAAGTSFSSAGDIHDPEVVDDAKSLEDSYGEAANGIGWKFVEMPVEEFKERVGWKGHDQDWFKQFADAQEDLSKDIGENGLNHPPVMMDDPSEKSNYVLEGNHRAAALIALGKQSIPVYLSDPLKTKDDIPSAEQDSPTDLDVNTNTKEGAEQSPEPVDTGSTGTVRSTVIPIQGGTQLASAPKQEPVVPAAKPVARVLPRQQIMAIAAGLNPNPQRKVTSVRELMKMARSRIVP